MAKLCTTIIAFALFCLLALTLAGTPAGNDGGASQVSLPLSEATDSTLHLPGEPHVNTETSTSAVVSSVPLTKITFRPVNRRFHVRSKHPCRHHFGCYPSMRQNEEIPYGNDMFVSTGENGDFQEPIRHGEGRRTPGRWVRLHDRHHHNHDEDSDSDDDEDEDRLKKLVYKRYEFSRFDREKNLKKKRKHFRNEMEEKKKTSDFMNRVRKFFDHYF